MKTLLGDEFDAYIASFSEPRLYGMRANTLKISPKELETRLNASLTPVPWCKEGFYYDGTSFRPAKHPYYTAGLYYIQEPSAMSTGAMLPIEEGDRVLDMCAAPGGKSTQVAAKLNGTGIIVANDVSTGRCKALAKNIELAGIPNAVVTNEYPEKLADKLPLFFNKIIVDAPCSGEGMFRKDENAVKSWEEHKTTVCTELQRDILKQADRLLCPGGIIAYSTCTFAPEEDEGMIEEFLAATNNGYELIAVDKSTGFSDGRPEWANSKNEELKKCARLMPYKIKGEGHFLALLRKKSTPVKPMYSKETPIPEKELTCFREFVDNSLTNIDIIGKNDILIKHKTSLIKVPLGIELDRIRVVRSGLLLGELKKNRFEPSQALAMALKKQDAKNTLSLAPGSDMLIRYLRGESFEVDSPDGYTLVCADDFPIGWGKTINGRMKNKYLPGWMEQ